MALNLTAGYYMYRSNFNGDKPSKRPYKKSTNIKLIDLARYGYREISSYDDDYFVSLAQFFMKKGYPRVFYMGNDDGLYEFFQKALFSVKPWHYEDLYVNKSWFRLYRWIEQFDLFSKMKIKGLKFYRNRASMPIPAFRSFFDETKKIFIGEAERLSHSYNSSWEEATYILSKRIRVEAHQLIYEIKYGCEDDYNDHKQGKAHSSWTIRIFSEEEENYVDFCLRIAGYYGAIINGDMETLSKKWEYDNQSFTLPKK